MVSLRLSRQRQGARATATRPEAGAEPAAVAQPASDAPPDPQPAEWPTEWLRGALEVCVLGVLSDGPTYGYAIAAALADAGLGTVKGGTLYPLLGRLEAAGLVAVEWRAGESGPGRKYYALNAAGREALARRGAHWLDFTTVTRRLIERAGHGGEQHS